METEARSYFADVINLAEANFEAVQTTIDITPKRQILRLQAVYGDYRIFVTELFSDDSRKYRYYVLRGNWVEAGFDNSPDPRVIRLKYGREAKKHMGELIPHLHREDKTTLVLTNDLKFEDFLQWLKRNIEPKTSNPPEH